MSGLILGGDVYVDVLDASGASTGLAGPFNCTQLAFTESTDLKQRISRGKSTYGQALDAVSLKKPSEAEFTFDETTKELIAAALLGSAVTRNGAGGSVTAEVHVARVGKIVQLAHGDVSAVVVKDTTGTTTFVAGTDYQLLSAEAGLIKILGGDIADDDQLKINYTWAAESGIQIDGGAQPLIQFRVVMDGKNLTNGNGIICEIDKAIITPKAALDLFNSDFTPYKLGATLVLVDGATSPYRLKLKGVQ